MKKLISILVIIVMAAALCSCTPKLEWGPQVKSNTARVYSVTERTSSFVINGKPVEGSVPGSASMDNSSDGATSLADIDNSVVYFVSENGIDPLGIAVASEEISFDGRVACYLEGGNLMRYSLDTRSSEPIFEGLYSIVQLAISPHGKTVAVTGSEQGDGANISSFIIKDGKAEKVFEGRDCSIIAISDDGSVYYYVNKENNTLYAVSEGGEHAVTDKIGAASVYNFNADLTELCYYTSSGVNRLFKLSDKTDTELCSGFGYTAKTNVYSISWGDHPVYINAVDTFMNGLFVRRNTTEGGYTCDVGVLTKEGVRWIIEGAERYAVREDAGYIIWMAEGRLQRTKFSGRTKTLAENVLDMAVTENGSVYYMSEAKTLFAIIGSKKPVKLDSGLSALAPCGEYCFYIKDKPVGADEETAGRLFRASGKECVDMGRNAASFERREGHLLIYTDPVMQDGQTLYTLVFTHDGTEFTASFDGVKR